MMGKQNDNVFKLDVSGSLNLYTAFADSLALFDSKYTWYSYWYLQSKDMLDL